MTTTRALEFDEESRSWQVADEKGIPMDVSSPPAVPAASPPPTPEKDPRPFNDHWGELFRRKCAAAIASDETSFGLAAAEVTFLLLMARDYRETLHRKASLHAAEMADLEKKIRAELAPPTPPSPRPSPIVEKIPARTKPWWDQSRPDRFASFVDHACKSIRLTIHHVRRKNKKKVVPEDYLRALCARLDARVPRAAKRADRARDFARRVADVVGREEASLEQIDSQEGGLSVLLQDLDVALGCTSRWGEELFSP